MRKKSNVMFLFAVIIYSFLIFYKHDAHEKETKRLIYQVDNSRAQSKVPIKQYPQKDKIKLTIASFLKPKCLG